MRASKVKLYGLFFTVLLLAFGCTSKKLTTQIDQRETFQKWMENNQVIRWDSIRYIDTVYKEVTPARVDSIFIKDPCDSLTGQLRDFAITSGTTTITAENGLLRVQSQLKEQIKEYQKKEREDHKMLEKLQKIVKSYQEKEAQALLEKQTNTNPGGWVRKWLTWIGIFIAGLVVGVFSTKAGFI